MRALIHRHRVLAQRVVLYALRDSAVGYVGDMGSVRQVSRSAIRPSNARLSSLSVGSGLRGIVAVCVVGPGDRCEWDCARWR